MKTITWTATLLCLLLLVGCGSSNNPPTSQTEQTASQPEPPSQDAPVQAESSAGDGELLPETARRQLAEANSTLEKGGKDLTSQAQSCAAQAKDENDQIDCVNQLYRQIIKSYDQVIPQYQQVAAAASGQCKTDLDAYVDLMTSIRQSLGTISKGLAARDQKQTEEAVAEMKSKLNKDTVGKVSGIAKSCKVEMPQSVLPMAAS